MLAIPQRRSVLLGGGAFQPPPGNVISNWRATGTGGSNGLPDGWTAASVSGVAFSVVSRTPYRGGQIIEFQFVGTAASNGSLLVQPAPNSIAAAAPGQVWRAAIWAQELVTASPDQMVWRISWRSASALVGVGNASPLAGSITGRMLSSDSIAPANTAFLGPFIFAPVTAGQTVNLRYRIFAPTLWRVS